MIWVTWRQFRAQALTAAGALAALATYLVVLGIQIRDSYDTDVVGCRGAACSTARRLFVEDYETPVTLAGQLLLVVPGLIGVFWGAPLITRELEAGTHRLVWNQSVTRTRWLAAKLGGVVLAAATVTGLFSLLLTWAASPWDRVQGTRFAAMFFDARNIVPVGYAAFAVVLGIVVGLLIRRTLPAMAVTMALFATVQVVMPLAIRTHLQTPVTTTVTFAGDTVQTGGLSSGPDGVQILDYVVPGAWMRESRHRLLDAAGNPVTRELTSRCFQGDPEKDFACLAAMDLHFTASYHPASRYWTFQWIELAGFLVAAAGLAGVGLWRARHGIA